MADLKIIGKTMYPKIYDWENLYKAYKSASAGKRGLWYVAEFEHKLEDNLCDLNEELQNKTYQPQPYQSFYIHEPKKRLISAAHFRDRVVHHALCRIIEPVFERSFIFDSYANRVGKGTHRALNRCQQFARQYRYVLQCDIRQFFPSIDHDILMTILKRKLTDPDVLWLCEQIISSGTDILADEYEMVYFTDDDLFAMNRPRGLPIGNLTSQFWANVYLNSFDHFIKRELRCPAYERYVDDFLLYENDKATLWRWLKALTLRLEKYRLTIHAQAHPRPVTEGIPFLGFIVFPDHRRLKRRKGIHFQRKYHGLIRSFQDGEIFLSRISEVVRGWANHARYGNTIGLRKAILCKPFYKNKASAAEKKIDCPGSKTVCIRSGTSTLWRLFGKKRKKEGET